MRCLTFFAAIALALSLSACGQDETGAETTTQKAEENPAPAPIACESEGITVTDAWVRAARAGQPTTAAYITICNGDEADSLLSVSYSGAAAVEIHTTSMGENGSMVMSPALSGIPLPAGELVKLEPGGAHIMLISVTFPLAASESIPMTLHFAHAEPKEVIFHVHSATETSGDHSEH